MRMMTDLARALDPVLLARDAGIQPDPWQADLLRSTAPRVLELACRQAGKSTSTGLIGLHTAIYKPASLTLIFSPSEKQSNELLRTMNGLHGRLKGVPKLRGDSVTKMEFEHGSRVLTFPGSEKTARGMAAADLVIIDEASRIEDDLIGAILPMLTVSRGRLIALTTPKGKRGFFYEQWHGDGPWHRVKVTADMCPRLTKEALAEQLRILGPQRYSEEYGLEFRDDDEAVFPVGIIQQAFSTEVSPLWA